MKLNKKYTITTSWDDGSIYDLKIAALLKKYGLHGIFYITLDYVGKDGFLTWDDIKKLDKDGFEIGSHTISHPMDLKKLYDEDLFVEIQNSKDMLETALGKNIKSFCYPRGRHNERVRQYVVDAGYLEARGTGKPGIIEIKDKFNLPGTIHIYQRKEYGDKSILEFAKETIDKVIKEGGYCNIWGHGNELEKFSLWDILEEILKYASEAIK